MLSLVLRLLLASSIQPPLLNQNATRTREERVRSHINEEINTNYLDIGNGKEPPSIDNVKNNSVNQLVDKLEDDLEDKEDLLEKLQIKKEIRKLKASLEYDELIYKWHSIEYNYKRSQGRQARKDCREILIQFKQDTIRLYIESHLKFLTKLVVQTYIQRVLSVIIKNQKRKERRPLRLDRLLSAILKGRRSLYQYTFYTLLNDRTTNHKPKLYLSRTDSARNYKHEGAYDLAVRYRANQVGKLNELFYIEDEKYLKANIRRKF